MDCCWRWRWVVVMPISACWCAGASDLGNFYRVPCDKRDLNYDKYFKEGDTERNPLTEFNSNNTQLLTVEQVQQKLLSLSYIREELAKQ